MKSSMQHGVDRSERLERIALQYFLIASLWILTSDYLLGWLFPQAWKLGSILKGLLFVSVTALMLHVLIWRGVQRMRAYHHRTRAVLAAASDAILVVDGAGRIQETNAAASVLFGLGPGAGTGRSVWELLPEGTPATWEDIGRVEPDQRELEMLRADGTPFPAIWRLRRSQVGQVEVQVAFIEDLTERRALERQLVQAQKMESVGRLAAGVTHDLNNLLSVILGYAECLEDHLPPGHPGRRDMEGILKAAGGAALLSRRLLTFSRQPRFHQEVCDIGELVSGLEGMLRGLVGENVALELRSPSGQCLAAVDPNRLEQVVINLAVNSRDAMPRGGRLLVEVTPRTLAAGDLAAEPGVQPGDFVQIRVSDTGEGMDRKTLERIFDPFFTTKPAGSGTGLGLSMVYGTVHQSGGVVRVESRPGQGTDFRVLLPRVARTPGVECDPARACPPATVPNRTVLVVEDDPDLRSLVARVLEKAGHRVLLAGSALEALRLGDGGSERIDLLLTDVGLPGIDGRELARLFLVDRPQTPVLLMSASVGMDRGDQAWTSSDPPMLEKPFTANELREHVGRVLEGARAVAGEESAPDREAGDHEHQHPATPTPSTLEPLR